MVVLAGVVRWWWWWWGGVLALFHVTDSRTNERALDGQVVPYLLGHVGGGQVSGAQKQHEQQPLRASSARSFFFNYTINLRATK